MFIRGVLKIYKMYNKNDQSSIIKIDSILWLFWEKRCGGASPPIYIFCLQKKGELRVWSVYGCVCVGRGGNFQINYQNSYY